MRISDWSSDVCSSDLGRDRESGSACGGSEGVGTSVISFVVIPARPGMTIYGIPVSQHMMPHGSPVQVETEINVRYNPNLLMGGTCAMRPKERLYGDSVGGSGRSRG